MLSVEVREAAKPLDDVPWKKEATAELFEAIALASVVVSSDRVPSEFVEIPNAARVLNELPPVL